MKTLGIVVGVVVALIVVGMILANRDAANRQYHLSVVNGSEQAVDVSVSHTDQKIQVGPGEAKTVLIDGQKDEDAKTPRKFEVKSSSGVETLESPVLYSGDMVLDVTGSSCILAVDYGRQYRDAETQLPEGEADLLVRNSFTGQKIFQVQGIPSSSGDYEAAVSTRLGEKLPEKINIKPGVIPTHVRLINVPCNLMNDDQGLYNYLNAN